MTETFEVGQKVRVHGAGDGEITYGPFPSTLGTFTGYVVRVGEMERLQRERDLSAVPKTPKFAVGDVVTMRTRGARAVVEYGPFDDRDVYVVKLVDEPTDPDDARTFTALASVMEADAEIKVGDRVRVTDDDGGGAHRFVGMVGTVKTLHGPGASLPYLVEFGDGKGYHGDLDGSWNCREVERVADEGIYTHNGVTYDLSAKYRDSDGDYWRLARFGDRVVAAAYGDAPEAGSQSLVSVVRRWGPLTRV